MTGRNRASFLLALQFMTRLPVQTDAVYSEAAMQQSPGFYPAVGVVVGVISGMLYWGAALVFSPLIAALLATVGGILVTGALHEDGFADLCDGLGGGRSRERVLEIMRDSHLGTYGVLGLGLMVGGKVAIVAGLPVLAVPFVLIAGHAGSRASALVVMLTSSYARAQGAASPVSDPIDAAARQFAILTTLAALVPLLFVVPPLAMIGGVLGLAAGHYAMRRRFEKRLGGYTGDCLGAVQQCSEAGFLLGILALV